MTTSETFTVKTDSGLNFRDNDPEPVNVVDNGGLFVFSGPHNGHAVPSCLPPCLGTDPDWFAKAHEATDLHMDTLFSALQETMPDASYVVGNYSRLVCDLNAKPEHAITPHSSEFQDIKIPHNQPDQCCEEKHRMRLNALYHPYHDAKAALIQKTRAKHDGVIVLDMHSFTPTWEQKQRDVEIGTIRCEKTPLSEALEDFLKSQTQFHFVSGEPYRVAERPQNAAPLITEQNNLQYLGLEIRNDLIDTPEGIATMTAFIQECTEYLAQHPNIRNITAPRSDTTPHILPEPPHTLPEHEEPAVL